MSKKRKIITISVIVGLALLCLLGAFLTAPPGGKSETVKEMMKDAVLHEENKMLFLGLKVNPGFISAVTVNLAILFVALLIRVFAIPRFKLIPGRFQLIIEELVGLADNLAKSSSPHRNRFLGAYVFAAGGYIFLGTLFELLGIQWTTTAGHSMALPAPITDINAAIAMGVMSYAVILSGGIAGNGFKGVLLTLKDFSLPFSMSFRLFGALLSGLLVTELVYYYVHLSFILPVAVGVMFTVLHALVQTYVLTMLTALFYGEVSEHIEKKPKKEKVKKAKHERSGNEA